MTALNLLQKTLRLCNFQIFPNKILSAIN